MRPDGQCIDYVYGQTTGQLDEIVIPAGSYQFGYHADTGRLASLTAPGGQHLTYTYDGFLLSEVNIIGDITGQVSFGHNYMFQTRSITVNGDRITYNRDIDGLLVEAGDLILERHGASGRLDTTTLGIVSTDNDSNGFGELNAFTAIVSGSDIYSVDYERDKLGRIVTKTETIEGVTTTYDYTYDLAGRLDTVRENGIQTRNYGYDSNGNRTHVNGALVGTYDDQDRLLTHGTTSYDYTANGELTAKHEGGVTTTFDYDVLGNLRSATLPGDVQIDYIIDGQNRRIGKKVNGVLTQGLLYQDQLNPVAELNGSGNVVARFVYADKPNVPAYMIKGGNTYRIISDHLGSPRLVIDTATGDIVQRIDYDEWGNVTSDTNPGFQPFGFAGGIYDHDTGLVRFGARDYDPQTGRWTAKDPIGLSGGINVYAYVGNDPINFFDPTGLFCLSGTARNVLIQGFAGAVGGAINGAISGGLVGAAIGGSVGAIAGGVGAAIDAGPASGAVLGAAGGVAEAAIVGGGRGGIIGGAIGGAVGGSPGGAIGGAIGGAASSSGSVLSRAGSALKAGKSGLIGGVASELTQVGLESIIPQCECQ